MSDPNSADIPSSNRPSPTQGCDRLRAGVDGLAGAELGSVTDGELESDLVELARLQTRLESERVRRLAEFDARLGWAADGSKSPAMWLARETTCPVSHARADVRLARRLRHLPVVASAFAQGELTAAKARLFADHAGDRRPKRRDALVRDQELLVAAAVALEHRQVEQLLAFWVTEADPEGLEDDEEARYDRRGCHASQTIGQMLKLDGMWDAEGGSIILSALDAYADLLFRDDRPAYTLHPDQVRTPAQRRADALVAICQEALAHLDDLEADTECTCDHGGASEDGREDEGDAEGLFTADEVAAEDEKRLAEDGEPTAPPAAPESDDDDRATDDGTIDDDPEAGPRPNREARRLHAHRCQPCRARRHQTRPAARPSASVIVDLDLLEGRPASPTSATAATRSSPAQQPAKHAATPASAASSPAANPNPSTSAAPPEPPPPRNAEPSSSATAAAPCAAPTPATATRITSCGGITTAPPTSPTSCSSAATATA